MISVEALSKAYGGVKACDAVTLAVEPGTITAIVGPNGAGKSTFLQLLSGVVRADAGRVYMARTDVTAFSSARRFALGMARTFQTARVFPGLSVLDSVMLGAYNGLLYRDKPFSLATTSLDAVASLCQSPAWKARQAAARERALEAISLFGQRLLPRLDELTFTLSYANRRRVEIARTLASQPRLLMLDEPTAGMNPTETQELADLLQTLKAERPALTIIFIEHKMHVVRQISQRVIVMDAGRVIADGTAEQALDNPEVIAAYLGTEGQHAARN